MILGGTRGPSEATETLLGQELRVARAREAVARDRGFASWDVAVAHGDSWVDLRFDGERRRFGPPDLGNLTHMPKVDPDTHQPLSDAPDQASDELRGGRGRDDLHDGANPTGSGAPTQQGVSDPDSGSAGPSNTDAGSAD